MTGVPADLGTANAARRAAALTGTLLRDPPERDEVEAVLLDYGEPEPVRLTDHEVSSTGVLMTTYRRVGEVETGAVGPEYE